MSLIPGSSSAPSIHPNGIASGSVATPLPLLIPYGITGQIGNVRASSSTAQTLVNSDNDIQIFTPTAAHDVNLPTTSVASGRAFYIVNRGGYALTIKSSGGNTVVSPGTGTVTNGVYLVRALQAAPTTAAHWQVEYVNETGTWSPSVGGSATYTTNSGFYNRVNNIVHIRAQLTINLIGTGSTSVVSGLPFTSATTSINSSVYIGYWSGLAASYVYFSGIVGSASSTFTLTGATAAAAGLTIGPAVLGNSSRIDFSSTYQI